MEVNEIIVFILCMSILPFACELGSELGAILYDLIEFIFEIIFGFFYIIFCKIRKFLSKNKDS